MAPTTIKTTGYLVSTLSVVLLGIVSWKTSSEHAELMLCLVGGMVCSVTGMLLRWISYQREVPPPPVVTNRPIPD